MIHELKILRKYFERVITGEKTFEHRNNDRDFQCGDTVVLKEFDPSAKGLAFVHYGQTGSIDGMFTGRMISAKVGYVLPIENNYAVFSLLDLFNFYDPNSDLPKDKTNNP